MDMRKFFFCTAAVFHGLPANPNRNTISFSQKLLPDGMRSSARQRHARLSRLEKDGHLHLSLDRADLWDSRPLKGPDRPEFSYRWWRSRWQGEYGIAVYRLTGLTNRKQGRRNCRGSRWKCCWENQGSEMGKPERQNWIFQRGWRPFCFPNNWFSRLLYMPPGRKAGQRGRD